MEERKTSAEWNKTELILGGRKAKILDPDGWDRTNWDYSWNQELITWEQYVSRACLSTCEFESITDFKPKDTAIVDLGLSTEELVVVYMEGPTIVGVCAIDNGDDRFLVKKSRLTKCDAERKPLKI